MGKGTRTSVKMGTSYFCGSIEERKVFQVDTCQVEKRKPGLVNGKLRKTRSNVNKPKTCDLNERIVNAFVVGNNFDRNILMRGKYSKINRILLGERLIIRHCTFA
jgi:hypothetical protein